MKNLPRKSVRLQPSLYWNFLLLLLLTLNFNLNAQTTCPAAENIEVSTITTTTARITYKLSGNISSATIEYGTTSSMGGDWKSVLISKTAKYWDLTNLTPATKYYFRIKSFCENSAVNITPVSSAIKDFTTYPVATCPVATNLSASEITTTSARINYSLSLNIGSATLEISSTNNSSLRTINLEVKSTYYDLKELSASTTYYYRIKTVCTNTPGVYSPVYTNNNTFNTTAIPVCLPTTNLSVRDITAVSARINYALPDALGSATFEIRPSTTTAYSLITLASNSAFTIRDGLTALTKYYVRIKTVCKNGGTNVAETTFTTLAAPVCAAASNVSISNVSAKGALISYKLPDGIKSATLEITSASNTTITSNTQTWKSITISNTSSSYQFTDLLPLTRYYARVKSICTNGSDNTSLVVYFTTLALPVCTAATDVTVTDISAVSAKINFILHGEVKSASLLIRPATSTAYLTIIIPIPSTNFVRKELTPQTKYFYKISTVCSDGTIVTTSEASFTTFATPSCVPATALSAGGISAVGAKIGYSLPKEISGATLEIIAANTASPTISTANWQPFKLTLGTTVYELQGLTPQTLYYFRIKTECTNGSTIYSEVFRFTTLAQPTCVAATDLKASNITSNSVRINFTLPKNINSAFLDIKTPNATSWSSYGITNFSSTYLDRGDLLPSTEYVYRIRTNCSASAATISPVYSLEGHFVTLATTLCTKATGLAVKDISFNSAIILYAIPAGTTSATIDIMMVANGTTPAGTTDWRSISIGLTSTSFTLRDLTPSTHYYVRITTLCTQGTKSSTDASGFITLASPVCAAATNVTVSNIYSASVRINFTLPLGIAGQHSRSERDRPAVHPPHRTRRVRRPVHPASQERQLRANPAVLQCRHRHLYRPSQRASHADHVATRPTASRRHVCELSSRDRLN